MADQQKLEPSAAEQIENNLINEKSNATNSRQQALYEEFASRDEKWKAAQTKQLLRKVDFRLLPPVLLMYTLNILDRSNLSQAREGSLEQDLGMTGTDFNLATAILFVGYLLMQLPSNMLIVHIRPSLYLSAAMTLWGVVSTCNAAATNFTSLVVIRFFLGFVEAPFFPGVIFLMSSWYTRAELTRRLAWFYTGTSLANMFGGLIAAGVLGNLDGAHGIAGWRWLFIIEGTITIGIALISGFMLPDYPATTRWLSEEEKAFATWRMLEDINEADERETSAWQGVKLAVKDYRLYLFILFQHMAVLSQVFQSFFPSLIQTLGYSTITTLLLTVPVWFTTFLVSIGVTITSSKTKDRSFHILCLMLIAAVGNAIVAGSTNHGARFFGLFLMPIGAVSAYNIVVAWVANSFPRPMAKRSAAIAICNMIGNTASVYGSYMYPISEAPRYIPGGSANAVVCLGVGLLALVLRWVHIRENRKLEIAERDDGKEEEGVGMSAEGFRYVC